MIIVLKKVLIILLILTIGLFILNITIFKNEDHTNNQIRIYPAPFAAAVVWLDKASSLWNGKKVADPKKANEYSNNSIRLQPVTIGENSVYIWQKSWDKEIKVSIDEIRPLAGSFLIYAGDIKYNKNRLELTLMTTPSISQSTIVIM